MKKKIIVTRDLILGAGIFDKAAPYMVALIEDQGRAGWVKLARRDFATIEEAREFAAALPSEDSVRWGNYTPLICLMMSDEPESLKRQFQAIASVEALPEEQEFAIVDGKICRRFWCTRRRGEVVAWYPAAAKA